MTVTGVRFRKLAYPILLILALAAIGALLWFWWHPLTLILISLLLLAPGRVGAYLLKPLYASRALQARAQFKEAERNATEAIRQLEQQPWRGFALLTAYPVYTLSALAMAHNNLGAARLEQGELELASDAFEAARSIDPNYPIPVYNLALVAALQGRPEVQSLLADAARMGFSNDGFDRQLSQLADRFAAVQAVHP
jgi:tetratricopeptide (TPR) repeat protein